MKGVLLGTLALGLSLALTGSAAALCICGDRNGCSSTAGCAGKTPGDDCGGRRSCKIVVGTGSDDTCCCRCSKGVGPKACNYGALETIEILGDAACGSATLDKLADRTETAVNGDLERANAACWDERNALKKANAARGKLTRLGKRIEKAADRNKIDDGCAADSLALLDAVQAKIDEVEAGSPGGTTSTTLPGVPSCSASFAAFSDPAEVEFTLGCFAAGATYQGFQVTLNGERKVVNFLEPPGFVCTIATELAGNDSLACVGGFDIDVPVMGGRIRTSPAPAVGMDATLFIMVGDWRYGPFPTTGP